MLSKLTLLLLVASCSTVYDLKHTKPRISYVTARSANEVMKCIRNSWGAHQPTVYEEKTNNGWIVRYNDVLPSSTVAIVTIEGTEPEVQVNYHHRTNRIKLHRFEEEVLDCKE